MMLLKRKWEILGENAGQMEMKQSGSSRLGNRTCRGLGMGSSSGHVGNCEQFSTPGADNVCYRVKDRVLGPGLSDAQAKM